MKHMRKTVTGGPSLGNRSKLSGLAIALTLALTALVAVPAYAANSDATEPTVWDSIVSFFTGEPAAVSAEDGSEASLYAAGDKGTKVSDESTLDAWNAILENEGQASTQNIGRIWTDKSVFTDGATYTEGPLAGTPINVEGDHDFLVGLSALSSTSNLTSTTYTSQPLDIVLVLDDSGSMAYSIDSDMPNQTVYTPISADQVVESHGTINEDFYGDIAEQLTRGGEYYALVGDDYVRIYEQTEEHSGDWWTSYDEHVSWTLNGQVVTPETTQFYTRATYDMTERRGALQYAVNNFIDQTAAMNAQITDENAKIRLSIVVFEDNASIENHLTVCEGSNVSELKSTVNRLSANGATNAGAGMTSANNELRQNSNRDNTKQIVIFFTDGVPTTSSTFATGVANTAVGQAGAIKDRGGNVYSIGIFDGADPSQTELPNWGTDDTDRANVFMNAVSSNYPDSTAWNILGRRATGNPDFYKSADNAGSLNEVFQDIFDESTENVASGSPIEGTDQEGVQDAVPGTLTFTDPLGDYMEVTGDTMTLVYGDQQYTATKGADGVYRFPDQEVGGNDVYKSANLSQIKISIQKGTGSTGDTVTVSMPASFIPLRNYEVTTEDGQSTMSVSEAYPIRLFYGVSVRQDALDNLGNPGDTVLQNYINGNKTGNGASVNFYANKWSGQQYGDAIATFTPNEANKFYYYTENTELYVDEDCTQRATRWNIDQHDTLYYKDTYWVQNGTTGTENTEVIPVSRTGQDMQGLEYDRDGNAYIEAGTQRYDRPATLASNKANNETQTAGQALNPMWANNGTVSQRLGNNGVIPVELPAQLSITKTVGFGGDYGDAFDETVYTNKSYEMNIHVDGAQGTYKAQVKNAEGDVVSEPADGYFDITFDQSGNAKHSIKADETLTIYGLDGGATYKVTENTTGLGNGFGAPVYTNNEGTLAANGTSNVTVANTYTLNSVTGKGAELFHGSKTLEGRDWENGTDVFTFQLSATGGAPMPAEAQGANSYQISVDAPADDASNSASFSFGDVTFTKPGVYTYTIEEIPPVNARPGMSYSNAAYTVEVTVTDNQNGQMVVTSKMTQIRADNVGDPVAGEVADKVAAFTNRFTESETTAVLGASKDYQNLSGNAAMDLKDGMFSVELRPTGDNAADAPMPEGTTADGTDRVATGANAGASMNFARIHFTNQMDGQTFTYEIREVPNTVNGVTNMAYDDAVYTVEITVHVDAQNRVSVDTEYFDADGNSLGTGEGGSATQPTFHNVYDPKDATLTEDTGSAIHGEKTLTGRDMKQDESFGFTLSPRGNEAQNAIANGDITIDGNDWTASVSDGTNGQAKGFTFGNMTFKKAGTYYFAVRETSHNGEGLPNNDGTAGMTYDRDVCIVTVTVTDENGELKAEVSYNNGANQPTDRAVFQNTYTSSVDFGNAEGGIQITKQLNGRNLTANEFWFEIKAVDAQGAVSATDADAKLSDADRTFSNPTGAGAGNATQPWKQLAGLTFNQADSGKTFVYEVRETSQATETVTTDSTVYTVTLTPQDNGDGTMYVTGSVKGGDLDITIDTRDESYAAPVLPFVNTYTPKPVSTDDVAGTTLQVTKKVTGANAAGAFEFELTLDAANSDNGTDGVFEDADAKQAFDGMTATTKANLAKDETETLSFGQLTFTKEGTYTFKVKETTTAPADYWDYDNAEHTITVEVSDNKGQLEILYLSDIPVVENKYTASPVIVGGDGADKQITVQKTVTGADSTAEFKFQIAPVIDDTHTLQWWQERVDPAEDFTNELTISGVTQAQAVTSSFAGIQFNVAGEYEFTVTEVGAAEFNASSDRKGWTYDEHTANVAVNVTDKGNGQLVADVIYDNANATTAADESAQAAAFTNKYESTFDQGTAVTLGGTKYLDVAEGFTYDGGLPNGKFRFLFTALDGAPSIGDGQWNKPGVAVPETNDFQTTFSIFDKLTFSMADMDGQTTKDFVYIVTEKPGTDEDAGAAMTYDSSAYRVTITVTDDLAGNLTAGTPKIEKGSWDGQTFTANADQTGVDQVLFVNSYAPKSLDGDANLNVTKIIDGRKFQDGDSFTFTLTGGDDATKKAITDGAVILPKNADGIEIAYAEGDDTNTKSAAFGNIAFKTAGDYVFAVTETVPAGATNPNVDNGATTYENATPDQQAQGGWTLEGVTYGNQPHLVRVEVTVDGDGALVVTPDPDTINPTITNEYGTSGDTTLDTKTKFGLTKELTGTDWDTESFTFEVSGEDEQGGSAPTPANVTDGTYTVDAAAATNGKAELDFGTITFDKTGTYTYTIKEKVPADTQGITYDTHEVTVKVSVTDNLHGGIEANVTEVTGEKAFVNEYSTELVYQNEGGLDIVKNLTGHDMAAGQFGFTVKPVDTQGGATAQEAADIAGIPVTGKTFSVTADDMVGDGVATSEIAVFDANGFHFTQAHDGMSYTYTVEETTKGGAGYTNDTSVYTVVISVKDDDAGKLTVTTAVHDSDSGTTAEYVYDNTGAQHDTAVVPFDNSYSASGSTPATGDAALTATKTLHNADLANYTFTFNVTNNNGDVVTRGTSDASGVVTFTPISYTTASLMADAQKGCCTYDADDDTFTYEYTVAEVNLPQGMTQNSTAQTVTVTVKDNGDGTLDARVSYPNGPLAFENTYGATSEATVNVAGSKTLVATDTAAGWKLPNIEGKFTFTVTGDSPLPVRADGAVATNVGGQIDLGTITYTMADMTDAVDNADGTRTKTFTYTVTEAGTVDGVTNAAPQTFTVEVTDDTQGGLTAVASTLDTGMQVAFENTYTVTPQDESVTGDGTGAITLTKQLTGDRTTVAAGEFNFEMVDQSGAQVSTGTTAADGSVEMSPITFTKAGDLTYTLREIDEGHGGVDYDKASYQVVAHVSDANADGTLQVTWEVKAAADSQALTNVTFTNTYTAADTTVVLGGSKVLDGRALAEGEFSFQLTDAEGNELGTVKNDAKGGFAFDTITYGDPGTYEYTISEVKGDAEGVTYDGTTYAVRVVVTDNGKGQLQVSELTYNGEASLPVFHNTYVEPAGPVEPTTPAEPPTETIPRAGDATNTVLPAVIAASGITLAVAGSLVIARRRNK